MENLADICEPQVPPIEQIDRYIQFSILIQVSTREIVFLPLKPESRWKIEYIDLLIFHTGFDACINYPAGRCSALVSHRCESLS